MLTLHSVTRIAATGYHCAFTSLCQFQDFTYVAYRQAQSHNPTPPGHVVIQRSADLETWEVVATLRTGGDDRDPHLVVTDDKLYCIFGTYIPYYDCWTQRLATSGVDIWTYAAWSHDGVAWGPPYRICRPGSWLWSCVVEPTAPARIGVLTRAMGREEMATPPPETWYGMSYDVGDGVVDRCHTLTLWRGSSPMLWERWTTVLDARQQLSDAQPSEPALLWHDADTLGCVVRTEGSAYYGQASRPFTDWRWSEITGAFSVHAPAVLQVPDVGWVVAGREYKPGKKKTDKPLICATVLWHFDPETATLSHRLELPSGGDCSYPGLVWDPTRREVMCSYYSQHDRDTAIVGMPYAADIYLARLTGEA